MGFGELACNKRVREYLESAFLSGRVPHAFLISGTAEGENKKLAELLARALVCTGGDVPCGNCPACRKAINGLHPDIIMLDVGAASIKVDDIRAIRQDAFVLPNEGERKVYIINNCDKMTHEAQDALLKILEEPPRFTTFILSCRNHNSLLETVRSRVTHLKLAEESASETDIDSELANAAIAIAAAIATRDELALLKAFCACEKKKRDEICAIFTFLTALLRDALIIRSSAGELIINNDVSKSVADAVGTQEILKIMETLDMARRKAMQNIGVGHIVAACSAQVYMSFQ